MTKPSLSKKTPAKSKPVLKKTAARPAAMKNAAVKKSAKPAPKKPAPKPVKAASRPLTKAELKKWEAAKAARNAKLEAELKKGKAPLKGDPKKVVPAPLVKPGAKILSFAGTIEPSTPSEPLV